MDSPDDDCDISIEELDKKILTKKRERDNANKLSKERNIGGTQFITDLMAGIVVGGGLGYYLDKWLETNPIFFIIFIFLGVAAGVLNIYKQAVKNSEECCEDD